MNPVRVLKSSQPVMTLLELLGRRWSLRILWELRDVPLTFRALQQACGDISPTVANTRLKELVAARLVTQTLNGYALTAEGRELFALIAPLNDWAKRWAGGAAAAEKESLKTRRRGA